MLLLKCQSLKDVFIITSSADPDEMSHFVAHFNVSLIKLDIKKELEVIATQSLNSEY